MDTSILLSTNALLSSAAAVVMFVVLRTRKTYRGFGFWTAGVLCLALGAAMLVPGTLPSAWATRVARNATLVAGHALILHGMLIFRGRRVNLGLEVLLAIAFLSLFGYYSVDPKALDARIVVYCAFAGVLSLATVVVALRDRPPHFGSNDVVLAVLLSAFGVLSFVRAAHQLSGFGAGTAFEALNSFGSFYAMVQILTVQLVTLTLISMNSQRIEWEYRTGAARLRESESQLRSLGDSLPDGFVYRYEVLDGGARFLYLSGGVESILGLAPADVVSDARRLFAMIEPAALAKYRDDEARSARELRVYESTLPFSLPDGRTRWLDVRSRPHRSPDGATVWDGVALDVTEKKRMADELLAHREHLEELVARRTRELEAASRRAEAANLAKSAFLANMSHEIRTPLNAMVGMAYLIRRGGLTAEQEGRLGKLESAAHHLLEVLNAVLDLSKIDAGKIVMEAIPLRVEAVVANVLEMVDDRASAKGLRLASEVGPMPTVLVGDATRLHQALLNYANNAIKFTERGSVTLRAAKLAEDDATATIRFEVEDTGVGIAPEVIPRLFSPFEQADPSTTRQWGGTGLGLTITRRLAELMGGEAGVRSTPGAGSTFWFTARLAKDPSARADAGPPQADDALQALRRKYAGERVLVAEDNPINAEVARSILEDAGFVVDVAVDGVEAVEMTAERAYRIVLMDMQMPRMDGLEASHEIRKRFPAEQLPIIAMTANAFAEDKARCQAAGMNDFAGKPIDPDRLFGLLLNWLERSAGVTRNSRGPSMRPGAP